jgi:hypothetical protein
VPDVVFLNCCFLGQIDREPVAYNRLAYSVGRELIEIGVRAVVVAGWAVDDRAAKTFAEVFYAKLVNEGFNFGEAVFQARVAVYESPEHQGVNTWGAYQAYGDPGFLIDPLVQARGTWDRKPVSPAELLDRIDELRAEIGWSKMSPSQRDAKDIGKTLEKDLKMYPPAWVASPEAQLALGHFYRDLGPDRFELAIECYQRSIGAGAGQERIPIDAIEQLANLEADVGESTRDAGRIEAAIARLQGLVGSQGSQPLSASRCTALGSAYKRLAAVLVQDANANREVWLGPLRQSMEWYGKIDREPDASGFDPYSVLNWLQVKLIVEGRADSDDIRLAESCGEAARRRFAGSRSYWDALMPVDAAVTASLLDGRLGQEGDEGNREAVRLATAYRDARESVHETQRGFDSVIDQLQFLARFLRQQSGGDSGAAGRSADRLLSIAAALQPGRRDAATAGAPPSKQRAAGPEMATLGVDDPPLPQTRSPGAPEAPRTPSPGRKKSN